MKYLGKIQDNKDLITKEYIFGTDTFVAKYNETTWSEMNQVVEDGSYTNIVCVIDGLIYKYAYQNPEGYFEFKYTFGNSVFTYDLEDDDTWGFSSSSINTDTKTSFYTTSSTGATTQAKTTGSVTNYTTRTGNIIAIKFSNANTYVSNKITLNINSTGAKDVWYRGAVTSSTNTLTWNAGDTLTFVYTGSTYLCIGKDTSVFVATYGTTTYAEIENAYNADIPIIVKDTTSDHTATGTTNIYQLLDKTLLGFRFSSIDNYLTVKFCFVNTSNTWSYQSRMGLYKVNGKTSNDAASDPGAITLDADDVGALASDGIAQRSRRLQEYDSRNVNDTPADLMSDPGAGVFSDFKTTTVINTGEAPTAAYYQVISYVPWSNNSGGRPVQMAIANKAGVPLIYTRSASSDSAWGSWKKLAFTDSDITGNAATADSAETLSATLGVGKGGTGRTSWTANYAVITGSSATGAFQQRAITNNTATSTAITASTNLVTMNTLRYAINRTTSVAAADTNYTTYMARGESLVTTDTTPTNNGEIAWVYG